METLHGSNGPRKLTLPKGAAFGKVLLAASVVATQLPSAPAIAQSSPKFSEPQSLYFFCDQIAERILITLNPLNPDRCKEDNSPSGPRATELSGACGGMMSHPTVKEAVTALERSEFACRELSRADELRKCKALISGVEDPKPVVTKACEATLDALDKALASENTMCVEDNSVDRKRGGLRFARLIRDCEERHAIEYGTSRPYVPPRVTNMVEKLGQIHAYCGRTSNGYKRRISRP